MICPLCHTQNRDDAKFCKGCGQPLQAEPARSADEVVMVNAVPASPTSDTQVQGNTETAPAQANPEVSGPVQAEPVHASEVPATNEAEDITNAPTLILTPEKMMAFHSRRWQQEAEEEHRQNAGMPSSAEHAETSIVGTQSEPTGSADQNEQSQQDVAEMPTVIIGKGDHEGHPYSSNTVEADEPIPAPPSSPGRLQESPLPYAERAGQPQGSPLPYTEGVQAPPSSRPTAQAETSSAPTETGAPEEVPAMGNETGGTSGTSGTSGTTVGAQFIAPSSGKSEEPMQTSSDTGEQPDNEQAAQTGNFPVLPVGTTVVERYEITQVVSDNQQEHIYQVVDRQGYQHCWNCGSKQNAEGDEFCIDCGASLLNVPYLMHEYPAASVKNEGEDAANTQDAHVLQGSIVNTFVEQGHTYVVEQPQVEQNAFPNGVRLLAACDSDAGDVRRSDPNEDSTLVLLLQRVFESSGTPQGVFIVADGLGGHDSGQLASRTTINIIAERLVRELLAAPLSAEKNGETVKPFDEDALIALFHGSIEDANTVLCQKNQADKTDMGSTITGFMISGDHAYIINVGDSRTYMLRAQQLYQLTTDHSLVGQLVASGLIEPDDVYTHPQRSQIFRSLGDKLNVQIDMFKQQLHPGDILLSCSDGLWEMVRNPQIESILNNAPDPQTACAQLIETANTNGGEDNISAVVVFVR